MTDRQTDTHITIPTEIECFIYNHCYNQAIAYETCIGYYKQAYCHGVTASETLDTSRRRLKTHLFALSLT